MKLHPTFEQLKQNAIDYNKKMSWFSEEYPKIFYTNFDSIYDNCCCKFRRNSIFLTRYIYKLSSIITDDYLISDYASLNFTKEFSKIGITASCIQDVTRAIAIIIKDPNFLSTSLQKYFEQNFDTNNHLKKDFDHSDFYIFAHTIFPSIFGYFLVPDIMKNAILLIKSLLTNNNEIASHLICAFFENSPNFLDTLFFSYEEKKFVEDKKKSSMKYFNFFIQALEIATYYLTPYHHEIIKSMIEVGKHFFVQTFINKLLLSQIKLRNSKDILIQILNYIILNEESAPLLVIIKTLTKSKFKNLDELTISGGFKLLDMKYFRTYLSGYEVKLILNFYQLFTQNSIKKDSFKKCSMKALSSFTTIPFKVYPSFNQHIQDENINQNKLLIFPPFKKGIFKRINEEYRRCFNSIQSFATNAEVDKIMFFIPELVNPSSASKVNQVVSKIHWENNDHFLKFAYIELSNQYAESASQFERLISIKFCENCFRRFEISSDSLFECQIASFKFDKNIELCNDFSFRQKIIKYNYNEVESFIDMTDSFQLAFNNISNSEKNMFEIIKLTLESMENTKLIINHILQTLSPFLIRKIPFYLNQLFEIAKEIGGKDEIKQNKCFFMILFYTIDPWKNFFDSFCLFITLFSREITDPSLFANQIKNSWENVHKCFQSAVFPESPSIEEYINILFL